jgi:hypothetical protein
MITGQLDKRGFYSYIIPALVHKGRLLLGRRRGRETATTLEPDPSPKASATSPDGFAR